MCCAVLGLHAVLGGRSASRSGTVHCSSMLWCHGMHELSGKHSLIVSYSSACKRLHSLQRTRRAAGTLQQ